MKEQEDKGNLKENKPNVNENSKNKQLEQFREDSKDQFMTTDQGVRVNHTADHLKAGPRGPLLMEDFHFREKMTHFDHESIPERVVHARGSGAHGYFQAYDDSLKEFTKAKFLTEPGTRTPVFVRFSTVVGSRGSADTVRDVRGFATKFYTEEGNYDLVGNNMPPFFIQDANKFADLVHAIKPDPDNEMPQASAAHDTFWDFASLMPESMHMIMWVLSDRAIPRSFRMMDGFGVHTFRLINEAGKACFVKFHWRSLLGSHSLVWDEAQKLAGKDADWLRRDLWEAIEMGDYPEFELSVQIVPEEDEFKFDFDLLDATKIIPEELVPLRPVGKMILNRNPDNFFAETEQVAFHPGNLVPGIDVTNDPLLQGRLFSYIDTQLNRFNSANFGEVPINRPITTTHNHQGAGFMRHTINKGKVNYWPNSLGGGCPMMAPGNMGGYIHHMERVEGHKIRGRSESFNDHYSQATLFWNSITEPERKHIVKAAHFELGKVMSKEIRQRMLGHFNKISPELAQRVSEGIGVEIPKNFEPEKSDNNYVADDASKKIKKGKSVKETDFVSMEKHKIETAKSRQIAILLEDGYDYCEVMQVKSALEAAGAHAKIVSKFHGMRKASSGEEIETDKSHITTASIMYDAIYIPEGEEHIKALLKEGDAIHFVNEAFKHCKPIATSGNGIALLQKASVLGIDFADENSQDVLTDSGVVTAGNDADADEFAAAFINAIKKHRHWDREEKMMVPA
ncbi:catalase [Pontibacter akesuensis]|uniref:Catalase n=1 Tax=Pontibacter akesuensis TaxID=388950 RepID=A0A1I7G9P6_9BACT|nr:catalase [Pontibacter akesuensis]GHA57948.1 catalase [Pontibacter akesuensis]SFU45061.1 catalase [Pontibacter akesuensis]